MIFINFMDSLLTNLILLSVQSWPEFVASNLCQKSYISLNTSWTAVNEGSKFKLDCVKSENSNILLIDVINSNLRLIS